MRSIARALWMLITSLVAAVQLMCLIGWTSFWLDAVAPMEVRDELVKAVTKECKE